MRGGLVRLKQTSGLLLGWLRECVLRAVARLCQAHEKGHTESCPHSLFNAQFLSGLDDDPVLRDACLFCGGDDVAQDLQGLLGLQRIELADGEARVDDEEVAQGDLFVKHRWARR